MTDWIEDVAPWPIPEDQLARVMLVGTPTTMPDGSVASYIPEGPQAHLAIQGAATKPLITHFHGVDQFQVFVRGSGSVGREQVVEGTVHYADRYTVYGPLRPGPTGMAYLTLRPIHDTGVCYMPASRQKLADLLQASDRDAADRRNLAVELMEPAAEPPPAAWTELVGHDDGLKVSVCAPPPGHPVRPVAVAGAGAYAVLLSGSLIGPDGLSVSTGSLRWCPTGTNVGGQAGPSGARVAILQFPGGVRGS